MKKSVLLILIALIGLGCNSQEKEEKDRKENVETMDETPKGSWKVSKEFDEEGNLIRFDSIYSWSSGQDMDKLASLDRDSILHALQSRFYRHFSDFDLRGERFADLFSEDSLFTKRFFNDDFFDSDFGRDFIDIEKMRERMETVQNEFLEKYQSEFGKTEDEDLQEDE